MDARRHTRLPGAGVELACIEAGPSDGALVILLHGFPEDALSWGPQIDALAAAGSRVLAPDQRGYGASDKPRDPAAYALDRLAEDVVALADGLGREHFDLVGHDWGGAVALWVAARFPDRVRRLAVLNAPHPGAMKRYAWRHPTQLLRSAYMAVFQMPWLPERLLAAGRAWLLARVVTRSAQPGAFAPPELARLRAAWAAPRALAPMLAWYRALSRLPRDTPGRRIACPTLIVWGEDDEFLEAGLATATTKLCDQARISWIGEAGHWPHRETPQAVNARLTRFLTRPFVEPISGPARSGS